MAGLATRVGLVDPGSVRLRRGPQTAGAGAATWVTTAVLLSASGIADPFRIIVFGAGACLSGALLVADPRPAARVRTLGWAAVVAAVGVTITVYLGQVAVWAVAAFLVVQMFLSFALQPCSVRGGSLAGIGALIARTARSATGSSRLAVEYWA